MKCNRVKILLSGMLDGSISETLQKELFLHIKKCANCRKEYEELGNLDNLIKMQAKKEPGKAYWDAYWERLEKRFAKKAFKSQLSVFKRLKEVYLPFFPLPNIRLAGVSAILLIFILVSFVSFRLGRNDVFMGYQAWNRHRLPVVLAKYEKSGYPESVAKAMVAQHLIKDFFESLAVLYTDEGLNEFVTYISKNGHRQETGPTLSVLGKPKKSKDYDTTITIPDVEIGKDKVVIKAAAKHTL